MALKHAAAGEAVDLRPLGLVSPPPERTPSSASSSFEAVRLVVPVETDLAQGPESRITSNASRGTPNSGCPTRQSTCGRAIGFDLDGDESHSVKGMEDASLLLTILFATDGKTLNLVVNRMHRCCR